MRFGSENAKGFLALCCEEMFGMTEKEKPKPESETKPAEKKDEKKLPKEIGGPPGPEPTRYGDWQFKGRVTDF